MVGRIRKELLPLACILSRDGLRLPLGIEGDAGVHLGNVLLHQRLEFGIVVADLHRARCQQMD